MNIAELLTESFPFDPGTSENPNIVDLRRPGINRTRMTTRQHSPEIAAKYGLTTEPFRFRDERKRIQVVLTKSGGAVIFYYGDNNIVPWREVLDITTHDMDTSLQSDTNALTVYRNGYVIDRSRVFAQWEGDRNRYSDDLKPIAQALLDRGLASPQTPLWLGLHGVDKSEAIGSVGKILAAPVVPKGLMLYPTLGHHEDGFVVDAV
jgi:hypothetical protein